MTDSKPKLISKKQQKENLMGLYASREAAMERHWLKGNRTSRETDILAAGRQPSDKLAAVRVPADKKIEAQTK